MSQVWKLNQPIGSTRPPRVDDLLEEEDTRKDLEGQPEIDLEKEFLKNTWSPLSTLTLDSTKLALSQARSFSPYPSGMKNMQHMWRFPWNWTTTSW